MGELRSNHFHGGLDIKTYGEIGLPIYASGDGYVSRISVSPVGYGKRLAITHPNGFVTHYGHLQRFEGAIEDYVVDLQYKNRDFDLQVFPEEGVLPVKKGDIIGYSGNSGSSGGPHLHYEIRDINDIVYNPLDFGFEEIEDNVAPRIYKIALKPMDGNSSVDGDMDKKYYNLGFLNGRYIVNNEISARGLIGLEIKAYDRMSGTRNMYGIQEIQVWLDGERHFEQKIDYYPINISRHINLHVDYEDVYYRGDWYQKCYVSPGNKLPFYTYGKQRGAIQVERGKKHDIQVFVKDAYGNRSLLEFSIRGKDSVNQEIKRNLLFRPEFSYELEGTFLKMQLSNVSPDQTIQLYSFYRKKSLSPVSLRENSNIYTYRLSEGIPDSIIAADSTYILPFRYMILPESKTEYYYKPVKLSFDEGVVNDTIFLMHDFSDSEITIHESHVPLSDRFKVTWEVGNPDFAADYQVYQKFGKSLAFLGSKWEGNSVTFYPKNFGTYVLEKDSIPPGVRMIYNTGREMKLRIRDDLSGIKHYDIYVNEEWILMEYDAKQNLLTSRLKEDMPSMRGKCRIRVEDNAGNVKEIDLEL